MDPVLWSCGFPEIVGEGVCIMVTFWIASKGAPFDAQDMSIYLRKSNSRNPHSALAAASSRSQRSNVDMETPSPDAACDLVISPET